MKTSLNHFDPHAVIRGLFSAPHLLPSIHVGSGGGAEPQLCPLPHQLSQEKDQDFGMGLALTAAFNCRGVLPWTTRTWRAKWDREA